MKALKRRTFWPKKKRAVYFNDYAFLIILIFLTSFGLVMLYSATAYITPLANKSGELTLFDKQVIFAAAGFVCMYLISKIDYHFFGKAAGLIYFVSLLLMLLVKTPLGYDDGTGVARSILIPGISVTFEPSEIGKAGIIIFTAYILCKIEKKLVTAKAFILILCLSGFTGLWVKHFTTNLSTGVVIAVIPVFMLFVAHPRIWPFVKLAFSVVLLGVLVLFYAFHASSPEEDGAFVKNKSYQFERIRSWVQSSKKPETKGTYQVKEGMYAIGSGGFWGKGLGKSTQKLGFVPLVQNDMIFSVICEELGIFGGAVILALFGYLLFRLMLIAKNAPDLFGSLLVSGVFIHIALQVLLNIAVVTNLMPTTGVTLPFFSSGGSALLSILGEMGIAWGVSRQIILKGISKNPFGI